MLPRKILPENPNMTTLYGIKNCDTVKKARKWLDANDQSYTFHDFRADGLSASQINTWLKQVDGQILINKRSTTWKQLSDQQKSLFGAESLSKDAIAIVVDNPTLIKRPVLETPKEVTVGFKENEYKALF